MTHAERIRIFRPHVTDTRLRREEQSFVTTAARLAAAQTESLRIQLARGTRPDWLILDKHIAREIGDQLASVMVSAYAMSALAIRFEIEEARAIHQGKPSVFAAEEVPGEPRLPRAGTEFYPESGVQWYRSYSLRLAGVEQVQVLDKAREVIAQAVEQGLAQRDVERLLGAELERFNRGRLQNIARTEIAKVYNQARWRAMDAEPEIVGYEWSAILDSRTCPICAARHGTRWPKGDIEGRLPPAHYMCRCLLLPIFSWEIESGDVTWKPVPGNAPPIMVGFGSTSMAIPTVARRVLRLIN